jgi:hypothetical protein
MTSTLSTSMPFPSLHFAPIHHSRYTRQPLCTFTQKSLVLIEAFHFIFCHCFFQIQNKKSEHARKPKAQWSSFPFFLSFRPFLQKYRRTQFSNLASYIYFTLFSATHVSIILICLTVPTVFKTNILKLLSPIFTICSFTLFIYIQSPTYNYLCPTHFQNQHIAIIIAFFHYILLHPAHLYTINHIH